MAESKLVRSLLLASSVLGARLFRNQVGHYQLVDGRHISSGLCVGSPDLIGWKTVTVTPSMVGQRIAVFVGIEAKRPSGGRLSEPQRAFLAALEQAGGIAAVVRSVADLDSALSVRPTPHLVVERSPSRE